MADTKITDLASLATPADGDELAIVDDSDTSMAASGTTKRITAAGLLSGERARLDSVESGDAWTGGTDGYVLTYDDAGNPAWAEAAAGGGANTTRTDVLANRGAAADHADEFFYATDEGILYLSDGSTWLSQTPGAELAYAAITSSPSDTTTTTAPGATVSGLSITPDLPAAPVKLEAWLRYVYHLTANRGVIVEIFDVTSSVVVCETIYWSSVAAAMAPVKLEAEYNPGAGARNFTVRFRNNTGGTGTCHIDATATGRSFLRCSRL